MLFSLVRRALAVAALAALAFTVPNAPAAAADTRLLTVTGEGLATARPDMAVLTAGVISQGASAGEALAQNSAATQAVIDRFKAEAIEARDIQTSGFSLQPVYVYPKNDDGAGAPPRITGYTVSNTVSVRVRDLAKLGAVMDKAVGAGANTVNGVEFVVSRQSELLDKARGDAVADAKRKAALYAAAAGAGLGPVISLSEQANAAPPRPMYRMDAAAAAAPVPMEAGESQLRVEITVTFALN